MDKTALYIDIYIWGGAATPCASLLFGPLFYYDYSFLVHHPVNRDDQHLLAHAMASDFTVTWPETASSGTDLTYTDLILRLVEIVHSSQSAVSGCNPAVVVADVVDVVAVSAGWGPIL
jgi:hypothetical protein